MEIYLKNSQKSRVTKTNSTLGMATRAGLRKSLKHKREQK